MAPVYSVTYAALQFQFQGNADTWAMRAPSFCRRGVARLRQHGRMASSSYRHLPWLGWSALLLLLLGLVTVPILTAAFSAPSVRTVAAAYTGLLPITALGTLLVLGCRVRTVVDDEGITQYWITRSYRIRWDEVTGLERDGAFYRWFLRVYCRDGRTFEIIPCQMLVSPGGPLSPRPPKAMLAVEAIVEQRLAA